MLRTVAAFREPYEAHMFSSRLEVEGIAAFVVHELHVGNAWHWSTGLGGAKVQVLAGDLAEARAIEKLCRQGEFRPLLEQEFGALEEIRCPCCGGAEYRKRRPFLRAVAAVVIYFTLGAIVPPVGWICSCEKCGAEYRAPIYTRPLRQWLLVTVALLCPVIAFFILARIVAWLWAAILAPYWVIVACLAVMIAARLLVRLISRSDEEAE